MGEPTTRSFTVPDTSTWPLSASAMTRAGDVDPDPCDLSVLDLDLAAVQPRSNLDPQRSDRRGNLRGAPHRASRAVEGCQKSVPGRGDVLPPVTVEMHPHQPVVRSPKV